MALSKQDKQVVAKHKKLHKDRNKAVDESLDDKIIEEYGAETHQLVNGIAHFILTMDNIKETRGMTDAECAKVLIGASKLFIAYHSEEHGELDIETMKEWNLEATEALGIFLGSISKDK